MLSLCFKVLNKRHFLERQEMRIPEVLSHNIKEKPFVNTHKADLF